MVIYHTQMIQLKKNIGIHIEIYYRYLISVIPVILFLISLIIDEFLYRKNIIGLVLSSIIIIILIGNFRISQDKTIYSMLYTFYYELTHDNIDVNESIINYLRKNANVNDTILTNYGAFPIIYYTDLKVGGGTSGLFLEPFKQPIHHIKFIKNPNWIIIRNNWNINNEQLIKIIKNGKYKKIVLNNIDTTWGNRPSPFFHRFCTPIYGSRIVIYKKIL